MDIQKDDIHASIELVYIPLLGIGESCVFPALRRACRFWVYLFQPRDTGSGYFTLKHCYYKLEVFIAPAVGGIAKFGVFLLKVKRVKLSHVQRLLCQR